MSLTRSILTFVMALTLCFSIPVMAAESTQANAVTASATHQSGVVDQVNLNTATAEQLGKLKGIGASKAQAILDYRTQNGPFKSVNDLTNVKGFSSKTVATLVAKNPGAMVVE